MTIPRDLSSPARPLGASAEEHLRRFAVARLAADVEAPTSVIEPAKRGPRIIRTRPSAAMSSRSQISAGAGATTGGFSYSGGAPRVGGPSSRRPCGDRGNDLDLRVDSGVVKLVVICCSPASDLTISTSIHFPSGSSKAIESAGEGFWESRPPTRAAARSPWPRRRRRRARERGYACDSERLLGRARSGPPVRARRHAFVVWVVVGHLVTSRASASFDSARATRTRAAPSPSNRGAAPPRSREAPRRFVVARPRGSRGRARRSPPPGVRPEASDGRGPRSARACDLRARSARSRAFGVHRSRI